MHEYLNLLLTLGFLTAMMWGMMKFMLKDIHTDIADIKSDLHAFKEEVRQTNLRQEARTDHLYEENNRLYKILLEIVQKK